MNEKKKIGDWVIINDRAYKIKNEPEVFLSNEFATEVEIEYELNINKLNVS